MKAGPVFPARITCGTKDRAARTPAIYPTKTMLSVDILDTLYLLTVLHPRELQSVHLSPGYDDDIKSGYCMAAIMSKMPHRKTWCFAGNWYTGSGEF